VPYVFLDFEASSLSKQSYPIEVGWVHEDGTGEGHLIRPAPGWTDWDEGAELIHHISRQRLLAEGERHDAVCSRMLPLFETATVLCSAPSWDGHWLSMLLRASGLPRHLYRLADSEIAFREAASVKPGGDAGVEARIAAARAKVGALPAGHRAEADARRDWAVWRAIVEAA
jgi:hypothetical protein